MPALLTSDFLTRELKKLVHLYHSRIKTHGELRGAVFAAGEGARSSKPEPLKRKYQ